MDKIQHVFVDHKIYVNIFNFQYTNDNGINMWMFTPFVSINNIVTCC